MSDLVYRSEDILGGGPLGGYYTDMFTRADAIIAVMCPNGLGDDLADAIRRRAVAEDDADFAKEFWPNDDALKGKDWAKLIARCAAMGGPPKPKFKMTLQDVAVAMSPNIVRFPAGR